MPHLALATDALHEDMGEEADLLVPALAACDIDARPACWDDAAVDWSAFDAVVIRATWDYTERVEAFRAWTREVSTVTRLANPAPVVAWNSDKRYLADLAAAGLDVVETRFVAPGDDIDWPEWPEVVVKPSVSAGARLTGRFGPGHHTEARRLVEVIHASGSTAMVQPFLAEVDAEGEIDVVVVGGEASHAVAKGGILVTSGAWSDDSSFTEWVRPVPLTDALVAAAHVALAAVPTDESLLYARVDSVSGPGSGRVLMELELVEPYLFLRQAPGPAAAAVRFAEAVRHWLG